MGELFSASIPAYIPAEPSPVAIWSLSMSLRDIARRWHPEQGRRPGTSEETDHRPHAALMVPSSGSCFFDDRAACRACTRNSSARKATLNASSACSQGSANPRKHDAANGEDL